MDLSRPLYSRFLARLIQGVPSEDRQRWRREAESARDLAEFFAAVGLTSPGSSDAINWAKAVNESKGVKDLDLLAQTIWQQVWSAGDKTRTDPRRSTP